MTRARAGLRRHRRPSRLARSRRRHPGQCNAVRSAASCAGHRFPSALRPARYNNPTDGSVLLLQHPKPAVDVIHSRRKRASIRTNIVSLAAMSLAQDFLVCIGGHGLMPNSQWRDDLRVVQFKVGRDRAHPSKTLPLGDRNFTLFRSRRRRNNPFGFRGSVLPPKFFHIKQQEHAGHNQERTDPFQEPAGVA